MNKQEQKDNNNLIDCYLKGWISFGIFITVIVGVIILFTVFSNG